MVKILMALLTTGRVDFYGYEPNTIKSYDWNASDSCREL